MKHVIIGAGAAGITAAKTIKDLDNKAEVVVIGGEGFPPYKRYLLRECLCGCIKKEELIFITLESLKELGIKLRKGEYVKAISPYENVIKFSHNEVMHYDKLLIATGGMTGLGPVLRPFKKHIQRFCSLQDITVLKEKLPEVQTCIVAGDGISSLDLICGLHNMGKKITYIVKGKQADFSLDDPEVYGEIHDFLKEKGIEIITEDRIVSIEESNNHYRVETLKHKKLDADLIFSWDYYRPNIKFIEGSGIEKKLGILVNDRLETSAEHIYAAGDCVEIYHPGIKNYWINFGWTNALEQGRVAGKNMMGQTEAYKIRDAIVFNLMGKPLKARWWK
ncbi:MAG: FAD-dependent oxidoreductase [Candidatus Scalindua sp.]